MKRAYGTGSVYRRSRDGSWIAVYRAVAADGRRESKSFCADTADEAARRLDEWRAAEGLLDPLTIKRPGDRRGHMENARALATHSEQEWSGLAMAASACHYCRRSFDGGMVTKDHRTPISRGGSDGIDNIAACCMDCNITKGAMTEAEFIEWSSSVGFFAGPRRRIDRVVDGHRRLVPSSMTTDGRGWCPSCGRGKFSLNSDGSVHGHSAPSGGRCKGGVADA